MPAISKIRFTNVIYEGGGKRYNDDIFQFDGHNSAILLENGGGKTVLIQTALQAVLPHSDLAERKIKETLSLEGNSAHIAIEWILNERPRRYVVTAVSLFSTKNGLDSYKYTYEYEAGDNHSIDNMPFTKETANGKMRPSSKEEIKEYYQYMSQQYMNANTFDTIKDYHRHIEEYYKIISSEWKKIALINSAEGGVESFFDGCKTTGQLVDNLLIPTVEEALAGRGAKDFVETFEKNREYFKKHKQLRARIQESKRVEEQINYYVKAFSDLNGAEEGFMKRKEEAKAIYNFGISEGETVTKNIEENQKSQDKLEKKTEEFNRKEASYRLALIKEELIERENIYKSKKEEYDYIKEKYETKEKNLINLQVSELKKEIKENEDSIILYQNQLMELDRDDEIIDIQERLEKNSSYLRGIFEEEENSILKDNDYTEGQLNRYKEELEISNKKLEKSEEEKLQLNDERVRLEVNIENCKGDMDKISKQVLDNPQNEDIEEEHTKWKKRIVELDKNKITVNNSLNKLREEKKIISNTLPNIRIELQNLLQQESENNNIINGITENHDELLLRLKEFRLDWDHYNSLYMKQPTIISYFEGKVEKLKVEREELLQKERRSYKFHDDYQNNEYFTADPTLESIISTWKNQFNLLETGTVYVERVADTLRISKSQLYSSYPYWSITAVTSQGEVDKLMKKIEGKTDILTHPVYIVSDYEIKNIINKKEIDNRSIFPDSWERNLDQGSFISWKEEIKTLAKATSKNRVLKENEIKGYDGYLVDLNKFYDKYPYKYYQEIQETSKELKVSIDAIQKEISFKEVKLEQIEGELTEYQEKLKDFEGEYYLLTTKLQRFHEYMDKKDIVKRAVENLFKVKEKMKLTEGEINKLKNTIRTTEDSLEEIKENLKENNKVLNDLRNDELYNEVKQVPPTYTNKSIKVINEERQHLKDILNKKQKGRGEIEKALDRAKKSKNKLEKDLDNSRRMTKYEIDEGFKFPLNGEEEISKLIDEINAIEVDLNKITIKFQNAEEVYRGKLKEYELREKDFYGIYDDVFVFTKSLHLAKEELDKEETDLKKESRYLDSMRTRLTKELKDINEAINELEKFNTKYNYLMQDVNTKTLSSEMQQEYPYNRGYIVGKLIKELDEQQSNVDMLIKRLENHQNQFIIFCEDKIYDIKLKEMAVSGIKNKRKYHEVVEWQSKMKDRIARTIKISEDHMREYDKDLQHFINHLHTHLFDIAQELRMIPKKTKVKIEDKWREIYLFDIPDWDEQEGKEELRRHVDWMINQLDSDSFKDEQGNEDYVLMKKYIEKWLQSKQLLKNVMKQNQIKVKCRKVTNDGKVSSAPYSWERSNKWSGGEKWSKNMALFLGVLNYLSEKKQHIPTKQKRHRTVIMDNPFGKASSDHVLDPVFFIAEQLGFQIIALTAHAEGKFIRDYFPVVYSCKLRPTNNRNSLVISKEKEIRYTFFRDHDPQALIRLGEQEQLTLFEVAMTT
ncbi:hypothetical protein [Wukongibacter sp. M2B1]|uniref:hypothetical protein n=1 Tax=Wukongibacter sp. M2B1 TaxID=3088895 RepID=UPI003D79AA9F